MADRKLRPRRSGGVEVPVAPIGRYIPGSGPPLAAISLLPPRDSTAYIIDQYVLPPLKDMKEDSRRILYYHIGFTDLPTVKMMLPCNKVLDYVSPRELEEWEYKNMDRNKEQRARLVEERRRQSGPAKIPGRVGRLPKQKPLEAPPGLTMSATEDTIKLAKAVAGPSLSTPRKQKQKMVLDGEDGGETSNVESDDAALHRQLNGESDGIGGSEEDMDQDTESVDQLPLVSFRAVTLVEENSSRASSATPFATVPAQIPRTSSPPRVEKEPRVNTPLSFSTVLSTPAMLHPAWAQAFGRHNTGPSSTLQKENRNNSAVKPPSSASTPPNPKKPKSQGRPLKTKTSSLNLTPASASQPRRSSRPSTPRMATPVATGNPSFAAESPGSRKRDHTGQIKSKEPGKKTEPKKKGRSKPEDDDDIAEDVWVVKELLDDRYVREKGAKVHEYLVKWEGDWPPEQNPTWEPAANIQDANLIVEYRRRKKAGLLKPEKHQKTLFPFMSKPQYSNVAEAFEGDISEQLKPSTGIESDSDESDEELMVTEAAKALGTNGNQMSPTFQAFDTKLEQYKQNISSAPAS